MTVKLTLNNIHYYMIINLRNIFFEIRLSAVFLQNLLNIGVTKKILIYKKFNIQYHKSNKNHEWSWGDPIRLALKADFHSNQPIG